ncbi:MAG: hypothetical protein ACRC33_31225 [Gemmataceae bacterium]
MGDPKLGQFSVRIHATGRASARWKGANNPAEAARLNQALSERRAHGVRELVEQILLQEVPGLNVTVGAAGVGSSQPAEPEGRQDDEAINRSVVLRLDLTTTTPGYQFKPAPPTRIDMRTRHWVLRVNQVRSLAIGVGVSQVQLVLRNAISGKEMSYSGTLAGGGVSTKIIANLQKKKFGKIRPDTTVGKEVSFTTDDKMGFADFDDQFIRVGKLNAKLFIGAEYMYLSFKNFGDDAQNLAFDHGFQLGWPSLEGFLVAGKIHMDGTPPPNYKEVPSPKDIIDVPNTRHLSDAIVVSFPTGKGDLGDLNEKERQHLIDYVTNKARNYAVFLNHFTQANP